MKKILIIDDEPDILVMLKKMMERAGFMVQMAANGEEGLRNFYEDLPDLVITDIIMPEKEGLEIIREMKRKRPGLKIIAISGGGRISAESYLETARHFGANHVFQKPFSQTEIVEAARTLLATDPETE